MAQRERSFDSFFVKICAHVGARHRGCSRIGMHRVQSVQISDRERRFNEPARRLKGRVSVEQAPNAFVGLVVDNRDPQWNVVGSLCKPAPRRVFHQPRSQRIKATDEDVRPAVPRLDREVVETQLRADLVNVEEVQRRWSAIRRVRLLDSQQPGQLRVSDSSQTSQRTTSTVGRKSPRNGDDLGVHRIVRAHREKLSRAPHPGPTQRVFQSCVAHHERAAPTATHLQERIRGV